MKQLIRPFHIRYTKERLIEFDNELSKLVRTKQEFSKTLNNLQQTLESTTKNKDETNEALTLLQKQNTDLESDINSGKDRLNTLNKNISNIENNAAHISEIKNQSDN